MLCYSVHTHTHTHTPHWPKITGLSEAREVGCPDGRAWASNVLISTTEKQSAQNLISTHKLKLNYKSLQNTFDTNSCAPEKLEPPRTSLLHEKNIRHLEIDLTIFFFFWCIYCSFLFSLSAILAALGLWFARIAGLSLENQQDLVHFYTVTVLVGAFLLLLLIRASFLFLCGLRSSKRIHKKAISSLLKAPVQLFEADKQVWLEKD